MTSICSVETRRQRATDAGAEERPEVDRTRRSLEQRRLRRTPGERCRRTFARNVAHGHPVVDAGRSSTSAARARTPAQPPAKTAAATANGVCDDRPVRRLMAIIIPLAIAIAFVGVAGATVLPRFPLTVGEHQVRLRARERHASDLPDRARELRADAAGQVHGRFRRAVSTGTASSWAPRGRGSRRARAGRSTEGHRATRTFPTAQPGIAVPTAASRRQPA